MLQQDLRLRSTLLYCGPTADPVARERGPGTPSFSRESLLRDREGKIRAFGLARNQRLSIAGWICWGREKAACRKFWGGLCVALSSHSLPEYPSDVVRIDRAGLIERFGTDAALPDVLAERRITHRSFQHTSHQQSSAGGCGGSSHHENSIIAAPIPKKST